jgi:DNA adenine methylase
LRGCEASAVESVLEGAGAADEEGGKREAESEVVLMATAVAMGRPALRYHGGKFRLAPKLIQLFPPHRVYTEVFGGGGSVLLCKPRCYAEIYNDLDGEVVNVFRVLQNRKKAKRLEELLRVTPFAREEFLLGYKPTRSDVERARRTIIRSFMGFGSDAISRMKATHAGFNTRLSSTMSTGFRWNSNRNRTTPAHDWMKYPNWISTFCERLQGVVIEQRDALTILQKMDREDVLHYVDPPYPMTTRKIRNGTAMEHRYRHEMTDADHVKLAEVLHTLKGMVIVSSYKSALYDRLFHDWESTEWTSGQFCSANSGSQKRTETVWLNDAAWSRAQRGLF